jgi:tetratricopeptide (TPR) repeat protein
MDQSWLGAAQGAWWIAVVGLLMLAAAGAGDAQEGATVATSTDLIAQGDSAFSARDYEAAGAIYEHAATTAEAEGQRGNQVEALAQVARCYSIRGLGEEGRPWLARASALVDQGEPRGWARYELVRGVYQREDGQREEATQTFARLYDFCREHGLHSQAVNAAHMAAIAAKPEQQIDWALKGIRAAEEGGFEGWLAVLWNNLGWTYDDLGRHEEALDALTKAREHHWKTGDDQAKLIADWSVGHALRMVGRMDEARERLEAALAWADRRYAEDPTPANAEWVGMGHKELGEFALAEGRREDARRELVQALEKLREAGMDKWDADGLRELSERVSRMQQQ